MTSDLAGKTVLITGAGSGIGQAHALHFAALGCTIIAHDLTEGHLRETLALLDDAGHTATVFGCDVLDAARLEAGIQDLDRRQPIHVLINNAGIAGDGTIEEVAETFVDRVFKINIGGTIAATRGVLPGMKRRQGGKIVNTSSNWGVFGHANSSIYAASKAAVMGLTKSWAREFAPWGITVNAIAPGGIETVLLETSPERIAGIPLKRHGKAIEVAQLAAFLSSSASDFITGSVINLNGGEDISGC
jgi:3-oxoacyl-[acyl-carrier protein] reductase